MLNTTVTATPDTDTTPATAAQVWARLGTAVEAAHLPAPTQISVHPHRSALIFLQDHDLTDLQTWAAWLGAPVARARVYESGSRPGHIMHATETSTTWRGWDIQVTLLQTVPVETVAVAFGQTGGAR